MGKIRKVSPKWLRASINLPPQTLARPLVLREQTNWPASAWVERPSYGAGGRTSPSQPQATGMSADMALQGKLAEQANGSVRKQPAGLGPGGLGRAGHWPSPEREAPRFPILEAALDGVSTRASTPIAARIAAHGRHDPGTRPPAKGVHQLRRA